MNIDYEDAMAVARVFCGDSGDQAAPHYSDGSVYATDGRIALAIHDVECLASIPNSNSPLCGRIRDLFCDANEARVVGMCHMVPMPAMEQALRTVLREVAVKVCANVLGGFGLEDAGVILEDGYVVAAHYAQKVFSMYGELGDPDGEVCGWIRGIEHPVLFRGRRWEIVLMPLRVSEGILAEVRNGSLVSNGN